MTRYEEDGDEKKAKSGIKKELGADQIITSCNLFHIILDAWRADTSYFRESFSRGGDKKKSRSPRPFRLDIPSKTSLHSISISHLSFLLSSPVLLCLHRDSKLEYLSEIEKDRRWLIFSDPIIFDTFDAKRLRLADDPVVYQHGE